MPTRPSMVDADRLDSKRLLAVLVAVKKGDFSARLPAGWTGISGKIADTLNDIVEMIEENNREVERVSRVVGKEGKLSQRASNPAGGGSWKSRIGALNGLIDDLVRPTSEMARVIGAVAKGFGGGGHKNAAGCTMTGGVDALQKLFDSRFEEE